LPNSLTLSTFLAGFAGVLVSLNRIATKAAFDRSDMENEDRMGLRTSTYVYFSISLGVVCTCWILFELAKNVPYSRYYIAKAGNDHKADDNASVKAFVVRSALFFFFFFLEVSPSFSTLFYNYYYYYYYFL